MAEFSIATVVASPDALRTPLLVVPRFEGETGLAGPASELDRLYGGAVARVLTSETFRGRKDEVLVLHAPDAGAGVARVALAGMGKRDEYGPERLRRAIGQGVRQAERMKLAELSVALWSFAEGDPRRAAAGIAAEAATVAAWDYREFKSVPDPGRPVPLEAAQVVVADEAEAESAGEAVRQGGITGRAVNRTRDLAVRPGNVATPEFLAGVAEALASEHGMRVTILDRAALEKEGMGALLGVAQGSEREPRFIILEYHGAAEGVRPLVLVGKGVTFDSGGISIKPAAGMEEMKFDMSGAAAVLGAMQGIAELGLRANVVALIPATENLPSGRALKPGDVIRSHMGKTIEVVNTDAEGRLILADALSWSHRYEPAAVLDAATLTGAIVVALGQHAIGLMGNDDALVEEVRAIGQRVGERCWPLPLWDEYREQLDSPYADLRNTGGRMGGSLTAGWFLREFAPASWAHLDIAGTAYRDDPAPHLRRGPTGVPTRLFIEWVRARAEA